MRNIVLYKTILTRPAEHVNSGGGRYASTKGAFACTRLAGLCFFNLLLYQGSLAMTAPQEKKNVFV